MSVMLENRLMDSAFIQSRITTIESEIVAYENALTALASTPAAYTINTGQTVQTVTRANIFQIRETLKWLYSQYELWTSRLSGGGNSYVVPT